MCDSLLFRHQQDDEGKKAEKKNNMEHVVKKMGKTNNTRWN